MIYRHYSLFTLVRLTLSILWGSLLFCISCTQADKYHVENSQNDTSRIVEQQDEALHPKYAIGFDLDIKDGYTLLHINQSVHDTQSRQTFVLIKKDTQLPQGLKNYKTIPTPVKKVVLLQTAYSAFFTFCDATGSLRGIADSKYIYNAEINKKIRQGSISEIGSPDQLNVELITKLNPDIVIGAGFPNVPNKNAAQLERLGIPVLMFSDWLETGLLGRAEWVKLIGILTGKEKLVAGKFGEIEREYERLREKATHANSQPIVIFNLPFKGTWYMPGGSSYMANLLIDANALYAWHDDKHTGGIQLDFENVFRTGLRADFWINPGRANTLIDITGIDARLADFQPLKNGQVYNSNKRTNGSGANDYWESGLVSPHIVLADFIAILHPGMIPEHELFYFQKLKKQ